MPLRFIATATPHIAAASNSHADFSLPPDTDAAKGHYYASRRLPLPLMFYAIRQLQSHTTLTVIVRLFRLPYAAAIRSRLFRHYHCHAFVFFIYCRCRLRYRRR